MTPKDILVEEEINSAVRNLESRPECVPGKNVGAAIEARASTRACDGVTTRILTTIGEIEQQLRAVWTSFEGHRDGDLDFYLEYVRASSNTVRPHVIVVSRNGQPSALLAGRLDLTKADHRLGYVRITAARSRALMFMGFRGEETQENCALILNSLLETLRSGDVDYAQIPTIHDSEICRAALQRPNFLCRDHVPETSQNHILRITGDFKQVYSQLSANLKDQIRRKKKKIHADFPGRAEFVCYTQASDLEIMIPQIEEIARRSYQRGLGVGFSDTESMRRRLQFCAAKGWLRAFVAYLGGQPAGFAIGTVCNKTYTSDFLGFDPQYREYSVGTVLQGVVMERCCEEGVQVIDFSAGDADYKRRLGNATMTVARVYVFAPHFKGIYLNGVKTLAAGVNKAGKYILAHAGFLPKIKRAIRSRAAS
jgi:Acetyltransferase (GNAT) domain